MSVKPNLGFFIVPSKSRESQSISQIIVTKASIWMLFVPHSLERWNLDLDIIEDLFFL